MGRHVLEAIASVLIACLLLSACHENKGTAPDLSSSSSGSSSGWSTQESAVTSATSADSSSMTEGTTVSSPSVTTTTRRTTATKHPSAASSATSSSSRRSSTTTASTRTTSATVSQPVQPTAEEWRNQVGFGYYRMGNQLSDTLENMEQETVRGHINIQSTGMAPYNFNSALAILRKAKELGPNQMTWLGIGETVFLYQASGVQFNSGWQTSLAFMMNIIKQEGLMGNILGFYFDEPMLCGIKKSDFRDVTKYLRETYPALRVMAVFAVNAVDPTVWSNNGNDQVLDPDTTQYLTDAGYDMYWDARGTNIHTYEKVNQSLKKRLGRDDVRIWYVPCIMSYGGKTDEAYALAHLNAMYDFLKAEKNPGGLLCYAYDISNRDGSVGNIGFHVLQNKAENPWKTLDYTLLFIGREVQKLSK